MSMSAESSESSIELHLVKGYQLKKFEKDAMMNTLDYQKIKNK